MKNERKGIALKHQIHLSYLGMAAIGLIILLIATLVSSQLRDGSTVLVEEDIPETVSLLKLQSSLNQALSSMRGWVAIQNPATRQESNRVWQDDIFPNLKNLENLAAANQSRIDKQQLDNIKQQLVDLYEWQWYIFEAAMSDGNLPAFLHFQRFVTPTFHTLQDIINRMINENNSNANIENRSQTLTTLLALSKEVAITQATVAVYVHHGEQVEKQAVKASEANAMRLLSRLNLNRVASSEVMADDLKQLNKQFNGYAVMVKQVVERRGSNNWNVANSWLKNSAMPLARNVQNDISALLKTLLNAMSNDVDYVKRISDRAQWIFVTLLILMIGSAVLISRYWTAKLMRPIQSLVSATDEIAAGNMAFKIEIDSQDEFGDLARSFDKMRQAVNHREQQIAASTIQLKTTIDTVVDALIVIDNRGIIQSINPAGCRLFAYQESDLIGVNVKKLMPEPYHGEHDGYLKNYRQTKQPKVIGVGREVIACRSTGEEFPAELSVSEMFVEGQQQFVGLIRDISERKREEDAKAEFISVINNREQKLAASATQLKTTIDTVVDALIVIDNRGIIQSINPSGCRLFAYQESDLIGVNVKKLMPEPYHGEHDGYLKNYRQPKVIGVGREVIACRSTGEEFPAELSVSEMFVEGQQQFVGLIRDISERKRVEQAKADFISVVSHELRTPLTSIRGSLGILAGGVTGDLGTKANAMLDIAVRSTDRLIRLINDILDIEKMESGMGTLKTKRIKVFELLEQIIHFNEGMAATHQVTLLLNNVDKGLEIDVDGDRIDQVMTNLLSNAIKYSPKGEAVVINAYKEENEVTFSITDKGPGIPEEFKSRIFQKFNQADSSATRVKGGTGLGLSIAKAIVEQHHGVIDYETSGQGTRFFFSLPLAADSKREAFVKNKLVSKGTRAKILICEDDADIATLLTMVTKEQECDSEIVSSAEQAKKALAAEAFDALFLDLNLPGKSGMTLLQELRADEATRKLPIIVISALANEIKEQADVEVFQVLDWLEKPINVERLVSTLNSMVLNENGEEVKILYVEDDVHLGELLVEMLKGSANVKVETTFKGALHAIEQQSFDLVILDIELPDGSGLDLIPAINAASSEPSPIMIFSAQELPEQYSDLVAESMVKSNIDNESLIRAIKKQLQRFKRS
jgi:PAS domain S-box-containing protein